MELGSADLRTMKVLKDGQSGEITIGSLYDGHHFGDVTLMESRNKKRPEQNHFTAIRDLSEIRAYLAAVDPKNVELGQKSPSREKSQSISQRPDGQVNIAPIEADESIEALKKSASVY